MKLIKDIGMIYPSQNSKHKYRCGIYECTKCGCHFRGLTATIKKRNIETCPKCSKIAVNSIHGMTGTRIYRIWKGIKNRCTNHKSKHFENYGGRGISICNDWMINPMSFIEWSMINGYDENLTIDRIDNDGNYEPSNCRWTTMEVQARNKRKLSKKNTSGYRGVYWHNKKWYARIGVSGEEIHIGVFNDKISAAMAYDRYVSHNNLEHTKNF